MIRQRLTAVLAVAVLLLPATGRAAGADVAKVPRFSVENMDRTADPRSDFYRFAAGNWLKNNPVPADKSEWSGFDEVQERNWAQIHQLLDDAATHRRTFGPRYRRQVGDFFASAMDTNRIESLGFKPLEPYLRVIDDVRTPEQLFRLLAQFHLANTGGMFGGGVSADAKNSTTNVFEVGQGGLSLPDRDYYLTDGFAKQRDAYQAYVVRMLRLFGESEADATAHAATVLSLETELARASKTRVELRDPNANYNKVRLADLARSHPHTPWLAYFAESGLPNLREIVVGQTNFIARLDQLVQERPLADWKTYLRWHLLNDAAPYLHHEAEQAHFAFYGTTLRGQPQPEPRWQRAAKVIDGSIGEALGRLYVERYYPPAARQRMNELVDNIQAVFHDRLAKLEWMSDATRQKALAKFTRFTRKVGHPDQFRDYSKVLVRRNDYFGNIRRAAQVESRRQLAQVGKPVDRAEWHMTPQTVNAYFNPLQNEIVFPAGILQPPFFDLEADDAINYGAIGVVIGHEITHGYDDQGRQFDADGNLNDWWTESDAKEFEARAQKLVDQYGAYEPLPGKKVNGRLTLGENIADLGGTSIAFEALQRSLAKTPAKRRNIDGFTPEQRFFLSLAQLWRTNFREAELVRRLTVDPHSPGMYRAVGPHVNLEEFHRAFGVQPGDPMYRDPKLRAVIW